MIESVTSRTKIHILDLLSSRPRCLSELADRTGVSTQGISKHLKSLVADGLVKIVNVNRDKSSRSLIRAYYRLDKPVYIYSGWENERLSLFMSLKTPESYRIPKEKKSVSRVLGETEDGLNQLKRRLRLLRNRESRIFEEMTELECLKDHIVRELKCSPVEEYLLRAFLFSRNEDDLIKAAGYFGFKQEEVNKVISKILD
ncbi:MAG: ArsR family transcriptional regulator [Nitrosopumilus sp.]